MKYLYTIILFISSFFFVSSIEATTIDGDLNCQNYKIVSAGQQITCTIKLNITNGSIKSVKGYLSVMEYIPFHGFTPGSSWATIKNSNYTFELSSSSSVSGENVIGSFIITIPKMPNMELNPRVVEMYATDTSGKTIAIDILEHVMRIKNNIANLESVTVDGKMYDMIGKSDYTIRTDKSSVNITATPEDSNAKIISGTGNKTLSVGNNSASIVVEAEDGTRKTISLIIIRNDNKSGDSSLKSLSVSNTNINFNSNNSYYYVTVPSNISSVKISATPNDGSASVSGTGNKNLNYGDNEFNVVVTAENGTKSTYTIKIVRTRAIDTDNYIDYILVDGNKIDVGRQNFVYNYTVSKSTEKVEISVKTSSEKASVSIDNKKLVTGDNKINIVVKAESGSSRTYILNIRRLGDNVTLSSNNYLSDITVKGYNLNFNKYIPEYNLLIKNNDEPSVSYTKEHDRANVNISSNYENGGAIVIVVTAENGNKRTYKINITKLSSGNNVSSDNNNTNNTGNTSGSNNGNNNSSDDNSLGNQSSGLISSDGSNLPNSSTSGEDNVDNGSNNNDDSNSEESKLSVTSIVIITICSLVIIVKFFRKRY